MISGLDDMPLRASAWPSGTSLTSVESCFEPRTISELGRVLESAKRERAGVLIVGGGTRIGWANPALQIRNGISTLGLSGVDVFEPDEGVLHAFAGTSVAEVQRIANRAGWELPLDAPGASSTIGGVIASAATGPRAQVFGRVADAVLGLDIVGSDGVASKCGGRVVKNVTGYDLAKLYCGSFGTLGVITGAWLRLRPMVAEDRAIYVHLPTQDEQRFERCRGWSRLTSVRVLAWVEGASSDATEGIYIELGGGPDEVAHDLAVIESQGTVVRLERADIDALRDARAVQRDDGVILRARSLGKDLRVVMEEMRVLGLSLSVDLGLGVVHARGALNSPESLLEIRASMAARGGFAMFERVPEAWRDGVDVFGTSPENEDLQAALRMRFDPGQILNPGRFAPGSTGRR